jgi:hypothetical protein
LLICPDGTILFKEDFGGNDSADFTYKSHRNFTSKLVIRIMPTQLERWQI